MKPRVLVVLGIATAVALSWLVLRQGDAPRIEDPSSAAHVPASEVVSQTSVAADPAPRAVANQSSSVESDASSAPTASPEGTADMVGYVRDGDARPVVGAQVLAMGFTRNVAVTDEKGWFRLPTPIRSGTNLILLVSCRRYLDVEANVTARADSPAIIVLERAPRISGTLVDPRGQPIEGYRLQALGDAGKPIAFAITGARGEFDLLRTEAKSDSSVVVSEMFTYGHGLLVERPFVAWGTEDLTLRTQSSGQLEIRVKRAGDATPVTAFAVCLLHHEHQGPQGWNVRSPVRGTRDDGVISIRSIPGPVSFVVIPDDATLQPSGTMPVHVPENGTCVADVVLPPQRVHRIRAFDRQTGLGVAGAVVRIVVGSSGPGNPTDATLPHVADAQGIRMLTWPRSGVLVKTKTEADGTAVVRWVGPATEALLQCEHPQYRAATVKLAPSDEPVDVEVALDRGMRIRGVVEPAGILRFKPRVRAVDDRRGSELRSKWVAVDAQTGAFELDVDASGTVRLDLAIVMSDGVPVLTAAGIAKVVAGIDDSHAPIVLDGAPYVPGVVTGRVLVDGSAPAKVRAHRVVNGVGNPGWAAEAAVGADGTFVVAPMLVGEWLFSAVAKNADSFNYQPVLFASCSVRAGEEVSVVGDVATTTIKMAVCDASGAPLAAGQKLSLALKRCPERRFGAQLGPGGVLRVDGIMRNEIVLVEVQGGQLDKQRGEAEVESQKLVVR